MLRVRLAYGALLFVQGVFCPAISPAEVIPLVKESGTYAVPVLINGSISLNFILDSGAADVSIPADVFSTLVRGGTITGADLLGKQEYEMADGRRRMSQRFVIRSLKVGSRELRNVAGSVAPQTGSLLLGQTFLSRINSWSIDNRRQALVIGEDPKSTSIEPTYNSTSNGPPSSSSSSWPDSNFELWEQGENLRATGGYQAMARFFIGAVRAGRLKRTETPNPIRYSDSSLPAFLPPNVAQSIERSEQWWLSSPSNGGRLSIAILNRTDRTVSGLKIEMSTSDCRSVIERQIFAYPLARALRSGELMIYTTQGEFMPSENWHCLIVTDVW